MGQISKNTKAITNYVQNILPGLVTLGSIPETIQQLRVDITVLENKLAGINEYYQFNSH
jgi:conjugal transfer/entry exclusion protein